MQAVYHARYLQIRDMQLNVNSNGSRAPVNGRF